MENKENQIIDMKIIENLDLLDVIMCNKMTFFYDTSVAINNNQ